MDEFEFCGIRGCHWTRHDQAIADVNAWQRELRGMVEQ